MVKLNCDSDGAVPIWHLWRHLFPSTLPLLEAREHLTSQAMTSLRHFYVNHPSLPIPHATHEQPRCLETCAVKANSPPTVKVYGASSVIRTVYGIVFVPCSMW